MKVLFAHNHYQQRSGEAFVYELDRAAAEHAGHEVVEYTRDNRELESYGPLRKLSLFARTTWAWDSERALSRLLTRERPSVAHFVNTFPLISPAAFVTCQRHDVPVVYNVQNYRLACPAATLLRDGHICTECGDHGLQRSVRYACYRNSRPATLAIATATIAHRLLGTFAYAVDRYLVPSTFMARTLVEYAHIPAHKLTVKPNTVHPDPGVAAQLGEYLLFAGRITEEKGIFTLLDAYAALGATLPLRIAGDGPLLGSVATRIAKPALRNVELLGPLGHAETIAQIRGARALLVPSLWFEGVPLSLLEAFACGVPVIASRIGSLAEVIETGQGGYLFEAGNAEDLRRVLAAVLNDTAALELAGARGRERYLRDYTLERNAAALSRIYREVVQQKTGTIEDRDAVSAR